MDQEQEQQIRDLAYSLWQSAERPYWVALEYWLMAEKMVLELMIAASSGVRPFQFDQVGEGPGRIDQEYEAPDGN